MPVTRTQAVRDQPSTSLQENEMHQWTCAESGAIGTLERGTSQDDALALRYPPDDCTPQVFKPWLSVFIRKRNPARNFFDIRGGMKMISVSKFPMKLGGEKRPDCRFTCTHYPHDDHDHGRAISWRTSFARRYGSL